MLCSYDDAVCHDAALEIFLDELYDASIFDGLSQEVQEQVVVASENCGSLIGMRIWAIACWMILSMTVGIPSCLVPPSGFGMSFLLTGLGL